MAHESDEVCLLHSPHVAAGLLSRVVTCWVHSFIWFSSRRSRAIEPGSDVLSSFLFCYHGRSLRQVVGTSVRRALFRYDLVC